MGLIDETLNAGKRMCRTWKVNLSPAARHMSWVGMGRSCVFHSAADFHPYTSRHNLQSGTMWNDMQNLTPPPFVPAARFKAVAQTNCLLPRNISIVWAMHKQLSSFVDSVSAVSREEGLINTSKFVLHLLRRKTGKEHYVECQVLTIGASFSLRRPCPRHLILHVMLWAVEPPERVHLWFRELHFEASNIFSEALLDKVA